MRINSMKLTIIVIQLLMISGIMTALFTIEIPEGNREVAYVVIGGLITDVVHSIKDMMNKKEH